VRHGRGLGPVSHVVNEARSAMASTFRSPALLLDSTPVECGRSRETAKRSAPGDAAAYGYCRSHERAARRPSWWLSEICRRPGRAACRDPHAQVRERARAQAHAPEEARVANVA